jgi:hypothetical protein
MNEARHAATGRSAMSWKECYGLIALRLQEYLNRREDLVDLLAGALYDTGVSFSIAEKGEDFSSLDPFTFFAAFNKKMLWLSRQRLVEHICARLSVSFSGVVDFDEAPVLPLHTLRFFSKRPTQHLEIETLWQLFGLLVPLNNVDAISAEKQQEISARLKTIISYYPAVRDRLQWAFCWVCPRHYRSLIVLIDKDVCPTVEFECALASAGSQTPPTVDSQAFFALARTYADEVERSDNGQIDKWLSVKRFSECFDLEASDFAGMLDGALAQQGGLLENTNNFYPYTEITRLSRLEPESVRTAFGNLFDKGTNLPARTLRFCNAITLLHERYRDRFAHWQIKPCAHANFFVPSIYLVMYEPDTYFLYSPTRAQRLSVAVGYKETFRPTDADVVEAYADMCEQLLACLAEQPQLIAAAKTNSETQSGLSDTRNHLLLDDIIVTSLAI